VVMWACVLARVAGVKIAAIAARVSVAASTVGSLRGPRFPDNN